LVDISVDKDSGKILNEPDVITRGFVSPEEAQTLLPEVRKRVLQAVNGGGVTNEKDIINTIKSYLHQETRRRPMVLITLSKA
jgi:ribonuclease J